MPAISGLVGRVGPRYKRRNTFGNESKNQLVEKVAPFNSVRRSGRFATRTKYKQVTKLALSFTHSLNLFSLLFMKNTFYTKKGVAQQSLFVTYLYVYVYDDIPNDNNSKFPKSPNPHP